MELLDKAAEMRLGLSLEESEYDISYIAEKLIQCSRMLEKLSDYALELTRVAIHVNQRALTEQALLDLQETQIKASQEYENEPRNSKKAWLREQLQEKEETARRWMDLKRAVSEVRGAVEERTQTMKRLDSDLRLHSKLFEAKVATGALPPPGFKPDSSTEELSLE